MFTNLFIYPRLFMGFLSGGSHARVHPDGKSRFSHAEAVSVIELHTHARARARMSNSRAAEDAHNTSNSQQSS